MKKYMFLAIFCVFILMIFAFSKVDSSKDNSVIVNGKVLGITEGGVKDAVFQLEGHDITYYVNRGLEDKFTLTELNEKFAGKQLRIYYAKGWTPLAPFGTRSKHITRIESGASVEYSEF
jgi:hypothetical protein